MVGTTPAPNTQSNMSFADAVKAQAKKEISVMRFKAAVEAEKQRLLAKKPWFPWRFKILVTRVK